MKYRYQALSLVLLLVQVNLSWGQGLLLEKDHRYRMPRPWPIIRPVPTPVTSYSIQQIDINVKLKDQIANVQVSQTFLNTGKRTIESQFVFPLPYEAAIDEMTLLVDGKELPAKLLSKEQARKKYEAIVRASKDPALLEWMGHGLFQTSVFPIPPGEKRTVTLHYTHLLRKADGVTDFLYPLTTGQYTSKPIEKLTVSLTIDSQLPIKNVYSPSHAVKIKRPSKKRAQISLTLKKVVPSEDFRLLFDVNKKKIGTSLLSYRPKKKEDGYFLLLATPQIKAKQEHLPKTVIFVVDKSGSMTGEKINQAREAAKFVLNRLQEDDLFNIVSYNANVESFSPELQRCDEKSRAEGLAFIDDIRSGGSTNIHAALTSAMGQLVDKNRPTYIIFLTDGIPTAGVTNELKIAQAALSANKVRARLLNVGVGYDVNSRLLDRLARENHGLSEYVRPNENIEEYVSRIYNRITSPVMTNVELAILLADKKVSRGKLINRLYPGGKFDLFAGEQAIFVGRYKHAGKAEVSLTGNIGEKTEEITFGANLVSKSNNQTYAFIEKLWATRRIGEIIDELDLNGKNKELVDELVQLSTKHGIITPYTSFLADENVKPTELAESLSFQSNRRRTHSSLDKLSIVTGKNATSQRATKQSFKAAKQAPSYSAPSSGVGAPTAVNAVVIRDAETDKYVAVNNVRQIGNITIYKRGDYLCTTETADLLTGDKKLVLDLKKLKDKVIVIDRFSKEYFAISQNNTAEENRVLSSQAEAEQLLIKLRGTIYLIR